jgi:hypothetical protein
MRAYDPRPPHYLISVDLGIAPARTAIAVMEIHGVRPTVELHVISWRSSSSGSMPAGRTRMSSGGRLGRCWST